MNKKEMLEQELKHSHYMLNAISEEWAKAEENEDGDVVIPSEAAARISVLIGEG